MPTSSMYFTPRRRKNHGITSMKKISDICPSVILPAALRHVQLVEERVRERVIELQRDADQERPEHEDGERPLAQQLQRVEPEDVGERARRRCSLRRRVRQHQAEQPEHDRACGGHSQRHRRRLEAERADEEPGDDPADRAEHADRRELAPRILHLVERQRVAQRERRHVAERVDQQHA